MPDPILEAGIPTLLPRVLDRGPGQPCAEACACFRPLNPCGWSDYGLCGNPASPRHGYPVRLGRDCPYYRPSAPVR